MLKCYIRFLSVFSVINVFVIADAAYSQEVIYSYPVRNAVSVSSKTAIGVRYSQTISRSLLSNASFSVIGSKSGVHQGSVDLAEDGRTVIFTPSTFFSAGEEVTVNVNPDVSPNNISPYSFTFQISNRALISPLLPKPETASVYSVEDSPVPITIINSYNPAPGDIYISNFNYTQRLYGPYLLKLDNAANVLFQHSTFPLGAMDFRPQPAGSHHNGLYTYYDEQQMKYYGLDSSLSMPIDSFEAVNGYGTGDHELHFLPNGNYALFGVYVDTLDMSAFGGYKNAALIFFVVQVFDVKKHLLFEWRTADHFQITDATHEPLTSHTIDYVHCNAIEFDGDTALILSSRNIDEVTKISLNDGHIIWRWGGKHNQFTSTNDQIPFSYQHDVRRLPNNNITLFDNGNYHDSLNKYSRAVEYTLNEKAKTYTNVWQFRHVPDVVVQAMGSVQRLANGNTFIGWGICDSVAITEVTPQGSTALEFQLPQGNYNYRAYKYTKEEVEALMTNAGVTPHSVSDDLSLGQNYPNPFSGSTVISFTTNERMPVSLIVYDALGREIRLLREGMIDPGTYSVPFDRGNLPNGIYYCKLSTTSGSLERMMVVQR